MLAEGSDERTAASPPRPAAARALVIDTDTGFIQVLSKRMEAGAWELRVASNPVSADALVRMRLNALVVDLQVIGPDCWEYLEQACSRLPRMAVIVCTGPSSVAQRVRGLRLGADAWVTKPCHPEELIGLAEAALRRHRRSELVVLDPPVMAGDVTVRADLHQVYVGETSLELTPREFEILQLLRQADRVLRREEIYERVWGYAMAHGDRSVDVFVGKLRQKLRSLSPRWIYIHTHFGVGYRFDPVPEPIEADEPAPAPAPSGQSEAPVEVDRLDPALG